MTGKICSYAMPQLEILGVLNPDAHVLAQEHLYQADPNVVIVIITQLSLKDGMKEWLDKAHSDRGFTEI